MNYPGGKGTSGVYQRLINQIPPHRVYIESHLGGGALMRYKQPASVNIGLDIDPFTVAQWERQSNLQIICTDAVQYLTCFPFAGDEFIYVDPPYLTSTRRSRRPLYKYQYTEQQHIELLRLLNVLPCNVLISGYWSNLYESYLHHWRHETFTARTRSGSKATEYIWMNYPKPDNLHDYRFLGDSYRDRERIRRRTQRWKDNLETMPPVERNALLHSLIEAHETFHG